MVLNDRFCDYDSPLQITMGLTSGQDQILCGDLMFSGHTTVLTLMYLITKRYSPPRAWWLRAIQWPLCYLGILFVLISGGERWSEECDE